MNNVYFYLFNVTYYICNVFYIPRYTYLLSFCTSTLNVGTVIMPNLTFIRARIVLKWGYKLYSLGINIGNPS